MKKSRISRLLVKLGVLGAFLYGSFVSVGSFVLYGCLCPDAPPSTIPSPPDPLPKPNNAPPISDTKG